MDKKEIQGVLKMLENMKRNNINQITLEVSTVICLCKTILEGIDDPNLPGAISEDLRPENTDGD